MPTSDDTANPHKLQSCIDGEVWKPVPHYEGVYEVSDLGRVRRIKTGRILQPGKSCGYWYVGLYMNGKSTIIKIHRLVAAAFLGEKPEGLVTNHKDRNKLNNRPENLQYVSRADNILHAVDTGLFSHNTISRDIARAILEMAKDPNVTYQTIADTFGINVFTIANIVRGKRATDRLYWSNEHGARNHRKLSDEDINAIKKEIATGTRTNRDIAKSFGIHESIISKIKKQKYWR